MMKIVRASALTAAAVLMVVACSSGGGKANGSGGGSVSGGGAGAGGGTPKVGGSLTMGTEAEIDGFDPTSNRWDTTGLMYAFTVYDPIAAFGADNKVHPYLAQALDHNADYTQWTITLRPNITFSNGDPLTGDAVAQDLKAIKAAPLTGSIFDNIASITATGPLTVTVSMAKPWVPFPAYLTAQAGAVFDPTMLKDPNRAQHPIGTGPFVLKEWVPGNHFTATKNPTYWQKGLPYLDSLTYKPMPDLQARESSLQSGVLQLFHSSDPQATYDLKGNSGIKILDELGPDVTQTQQDLIMLNTAAPPLNDPVLRQALAYATNEQQFNTIQNHGLTPPSDGPFANVGSPYHQATGYPTYDLAKAKQLVQQYEQAHGVSSVTVQLLATTSPRDLQEVEFLQQEWKQAGVNSTISQLQQSQFILYALLGKYQAITWRQFGDPDPDGDYIWWASTTAAPVGSFSLNFARNKDPQIQADLDKGRSDPNQAVRVAAYQDVAKRFAVDVPYLWLDQTVWQIVYKTDVHGVVGDKLPDGTPRITHTLGGWFLPAYMWVG